MGATAASSSATLLAARSSLRLRARTFGIERVGLLAVLVAFFVASLLFALQMAPFYGADESAHLGYAHAVASGRLPEITDVVDPPRDASDWRMRIAGAADREHRSVWVANHPPLFYVAVAPLIWISNGLGRADGGLMFVRIANIAFATIGLVFTYALARVLTGGSRKLALTATALAGFLPLGHATFAAGMNDGLGFAAATAVTYGAMRLVTNGFRRSDTVMLGATAAVAAGSRAASMFIAVLVVAIAAAARAMRPTGTRSARCRDAAAVVALGLLPGAVIFGWFYARSVALYGDLTGSSFLFAYFDRTPSGSAFDVLTSGTLWWDAVERFAMSTVPGAQSPPAAAVVTSIFGIAALVGLALMATSRRPARHSAMAHVIGVGVLAATVAMMINHVAGGGSAHARYLLPALGVIATYFAIGLDRVWSAVLPLAAAATMCLWPAHFLPRRVANEIDVLPILASPLTAPSAVALGCVGAIASIVALIALGDGVTRRRRLRQDDGRRSLLPP
ncbi:MAG: hypothetical protein M3501_02860 [Actinomycetota bacterium]|nr:hypothetical protein [Actinomycetota bacterium]